MSMRDPASLTLGLVGILAVAGVMRRQGSRATRPEIDPALPAELVLHLDALAQEYRGVGPQKWGQTPYRNWEGNLVFARDHGLTFLGMGTSRSVFAVPVQFAGGARPRSAEIALKIGNSADNRSEARVWREAPEWMRDLLVPVLDIAADGSWLAMERVEPITEEAFVELRDNLASRRTRRLLLDCGLLDLGMMNTAADGRILDYAFLGNEQQWKGCTGFGQSARMREWVAKGSDPKLLKWVKNG